MKVENLSKMTKGWFIGNFEPSMYKTNDVEVAVKSYKKGDKEALHYHKVATEFTAVLTGKVRMFEKEFVKNDVVKIEPGESTSFECLEDAVTVVVKIPGASNDKYLVG